MSDPVTIGNATLYQGDCLDVMAGLDAGSVDLCLTDPPFGVTQCKWDSVIPLDAMWQAVNRIMKPASPVALFGSQPFTSALVMSNPKMFKYDWCWRKPKGTGHLNAKKMPMRDKEDILVFYDKPCKYNPQMAQGTPYKEKSGWKGTDGYAGYGVDKRIGNDNAGFRYPKQVIEFGVVERGSVHPTQKPVPLLEYLIRTYTDPGDVVLDFTMGSGSTGVAAANTGRRFIGIEREPEYFDIACRRIEAAQRQGQLDFEVAA